MSSIKLVNINQMSASNEHLNESGEEFDLLRSNFEAEEK